MISKPKIGILFITSGWFHDVGLQSDTTPITQEVEIISEEIVKKLSDFITPIHSGVIYSVKEAEAAAEKMLSERIDAVIIAPLMWCEDQILKAALKVLGKLPVIVCTFFPYKSLPEHLSFDDMLKGSGSVCALQISGMLKREGYDYSSVNGWYKDDRVYRDIEDVCKAFSVSKLLKNTRCGVLPFRCDYMTVTYVDEFTLRRDYGIELVYIELKKLQELAQGVTENEIENFREEIVREGYIVEVDNRNLIEGIRYSLALEKASDLYNIDILAMNDIIDEMHSLIGLRPCLTNRRLSDKGFFVAMETDIAAVIAMRILGLSTGESPFYSEVFTADIENNALLMGHAGYHDTVNHDKNSPVKVIADAEYKNSDRFTGACIYFKFKPGPVTAVNCIFDNSRLRMTFFEGESLAGPTKMDGNCHALVRPDMDVTDFYNKSIEIGVSQHWIIVPGRQTKRLKEICLRAGIELINL